MIRIYDGHQYELVGDPPHTRAMARKHCGSLLHRHHREHESYVLVRSLRRK
jgi:hypothetical protein